MEKHPVKTNRQKLEDKIAEQATEIENMEYVVTSIPPKNPVAIREVQHQIQGHRFTFTCPGSAKFSSTVMWLDEATGEPQKLEDKRLDIKETRIVLVKRKLYAFKFGSPVSAFKYADFTNAEQLVKTALSTLPRNEHLSSFSVT